MDFKRTVIPFEKSNINQFTVFQKTQTGLIDRKYFDISHYKDYWFNNVEKYFNQNESEIFFHQLNSFKFLKTLITNQPKIAIKNLANDLFQTEGEKITLSDIINIIKGKKFTVLKSQYKFYRTGIFNLFFKRNKQEDLDELTPEKLFKDKSQLTLFEILNKISEKLPRKDNINAKAEEKNPETNVFDDILTGKYNALDLMSNVQKDQVLDQEIKNRILNDSLLEEVNKKEEESEEERKEPINLLDDEDDEIKKDFENIQENTELNNETFQEKISQKQVNEMRSQISIADVFYLVDFQIPKNKMIIKNISSIEISYGKIVLYCDHCTFSGNFDIVLKKEKKCIVGRHKCKFCSQKKEERISQNLKSDNFTYRKKAYILMSK